MPQQADGRVVRTRRIARTLCRHLKNGGRRGGGGVSVEMSWQETKWGACILGELVWRHSCTCCTTAAIIIQQWTRRNENEEGTPIPIPIPIPIPAPHPHAHVPTTALPLLLLVHTLHRNSSYDGGHQLQCKHPWNPSPAPVHPYVRTSTGAYYSVSTERSITARVSRACGWIK